MPAMPKATVRLLALLVDRVPIVHEHRCDTLSVSFAMMSNPAFSRRPCLKYRIEQVIVKANRHPSSRKSS